VKRDEQLCSPLFFLQLSPSCFVDLDDTMVIAPAIENHAHSDVGRFFCVLIAFGDEEVTSGRVCGHTDL